MIFCPLKQFCGTPVRCVGSQENYSRMRCQEWRILTASLSAKIDLKMTLCGGQCFTWYATPRQTYLGVVKDRLFELREVQCPKRLSLSCAPSGSHDAHQKSAFGLAYGCCYVEYRCLTAAEPQRPLQPRAKQSRRDPMSLVEDSSCDDEDDERLLTMYLALDVDLPQLWKRWTAAPATAHHQLVRYLLSENEFTAPAKSGGAPARCHHDAVQPYIPIRHLRQDLHSCLFSFLCSQNNHVSRITDMVYSLSTNYGTRLCDVNLATSEVRPPPPPNSRALRLPSLLRRSSGGRQVDDPAELSWVTIAVFPTVEQLHRVSEAALRESGFGYRSPYITAAVQIIRDARKEAVSPVVGSSLFPRRSDSNLRQHASSTLAEPFYIALLRCPDNIEGQRSALLRLPGVGRKVADCVLLFSLSHSALVPVDTHMAQIAAEFLIPVVKGKREKAIVVAGTAAEKNSRQRGNISADKRVKSTGAAAQAPWWVVELENWALRNVAPVGKGRKTAGKPRSSRGDAAKKVKQVPPLYNRHHDAIQEGFRYLFGDYAGWAHSILFYYRMR